MWTRLSVGLLCAWALAGCAGHFYRERTSERELAGDLFRCRQASYGRLMVIDCMKAQGYGYSQWGWPGAGNP